jgi:hypothetical protein
MVKAQLVLDTLAGAPVPQAMGAKVLDAYAYSFKEHLPDKTVTNQVCDDAEPPVCTDVDRQVQMVPDDLTVEQKATFFLQQTKRIVEKLTQGRTRTLKEADVAADRKAIDKVVDATVDATTL